VLPIDGEKVNNITTPRLHPRTARLMRELTGSDLSEQTRRDHEDVAAIVQQGKMERGIAVANFTAAVTAWVANQMASFVATSR
jgi:hypothetical protein